MSCNSKKGGYTKVVFGTTIGLSTSTEIEGLLNGTTLGTGEGLTEDDASGRPVATGTRLSPVVRTSAITSAPITALERHKNGCDELYFRYYLNGSGRIVVGPVRVSAVVFSGADAGSLHSYTINLAAFDEDSTDYITVEA